MISINNDFIFDARNDIQFTDNVNNNKSNVNYTNCFCYS